jgi:uncharacterized membrane protein
MFRRSRTEKLKDQATSASEFAAALAKDNKFRREMAAAVGHGIAAQRRAARRLGLVAAVARVSGDPKLQREVRKMAENLTNAWGRVGKKQSHKLRNTLIIVGVGGAAAAATVVVRKKMSGPGAGDTDYAGSTTPRTIEETIEVGVPGSTAYNQWTQFEDFPLFMEGVDDVRQLDDTRLHWVATIAGKQNEWDAKILEQHADQQVSWISEDGKKTRGTVTFEPVGDSATRIRISMSYQADPFEAIGSAAGLDQRRVRGDLERFKELIESRGAETGAWRGDISAGTPSTTNQ